MGADLLLAWSPAPTELTDKTLRAAKNHVALMGPTALEIAYDDAFGMSVSDRHGVTGTDDESIPDYKAARDEIGAAMDEVWVYANIARGEILHLPDGINGGGPCFLAGGTSYGDSCEWVDRVCLIAASGALNRYECHIRASVR